MHLQANPNYKKYHKKPFPAFNKIASVIEGNQATGEWALSRTEAVMIQMEARNCSDSATDSSLVSTPTIGTPDSQARASRSSSITPLSAPLTGRRRNNGAAKQAALDSILGLVKQIQESNETLDKIANVLSQENSCSAKVNAWLDKLNSPSWPLTRRISAMLVLAKEEQFCATLINISEDSRLLMLEEFLSALDK